MKEYKTVNDVLVTDPDDAMRKTILATRGALAVPKRTIDAMLAKEKADKSKRK